METYQWGYWCSGGVRAKGHRVVLGEIGLPNPAGSAELHDALGKDLWSTQDIKCDVRGCEAITHVTVDKTLVFDRVSRP